MPHAISSTRSLPEPVLDVLVVATEAPARARLAAQVRHALPAAQVHELSQLADLVYRVAGSGVGLVLLDAEPPQPLPPLMVQMLRGIQPALRIVCVTRATPACAPAPAPASTPATDASLADASLCGWLRTTYGGAGAAAAAGNLPEHRP